VLRQLHDHTHVEMQEWFLLTSCPPIGVGTIGLFGQVAFNVHTF